MPSFASRPIGAGDLDRLITLQTAAVGQSNSGEPTFDWDGGTSVQIWAEWLPAGTKEAWHAQQRLATQVDGVFRIYDISPRPAPEKSRILFDSRIFDVHPYIEIGRGEGLEVPVVASDAKAAA